jgi:PAS domain S-box-containing protein
MQLSAKNSDPKILGQLFLMLAKTTDLPDEKSIFSFICRGLPDIPGVENARHADRAAASRPAAAVRLPIRAPEADYGELLINISDAAAFAPYRQYLENFCSTIAVILDEKNKSRRYQELVAKLEFIIQERTADLQESEYKLASVFDSSTDAIIICEQNGHITRANRAVEDLFGYRPEELKDAKLSHLMPERYREAHLQGMQRAISTGRTDYLNRVHQYHGLTKDGREFPLEINVATWFIGEKQYFSGIIRDISARQKAEDALRDSEEKLNIIFNSTNDGILVADAHTRKFITGNRTISEMLGYTQEEIRNLGIDDIHPVESLAEVHRQFGRQFRKEIDVYHDAPVLRKDASVFYADISASPAKLGGQDCLIGLFRDITEQKEMNERARQSQKLEAIGTLAGGIAHDFNNILSAILGYGDLALAKVAPGSELHEDLEQILTAGNRARELVKQILSFSRKSEVAIAPLRIQIILKEVIKLLRSSIPTTIEIKHDIDNNCGPVNADATQIHQIIMNLCTNAFHAMEKAGGCLNIVLREVELSEKDTADCHDLVAGRHAKLEISDTGTGIEKEIINNIFDPYFTTKKEGKGTGLGLSVTYGIVKSYGGEITCSSVPGEGSIFSVYIPIITAAPDKEAEDQTPPPLGHNEKILFIDDEEALTAIGVKILTSLGYAVFPMTNSRQALKEFQADPNRFDLVITDQTMPYMPGSELAKELLRIRPDIPIILCTGHSSVIDLEIAKSIGIKAFVMKPVSKKVLAKKIRDVLADTD